MRVFVIFIAVLSFSLPSFADQGPNIPSPSQDLHRELVYVQVAQDKLYFTACIDSASICRVLGGRGFTERELRRFSSQLILEGTGKGALALGAATVSGVAGFLVAAYGVSNFVLSPIATFLPSIYNTLFPRSVEQGTIIAGGLMAFTAAGWYVFDLIDPRPKFISSRAIRRSLKTSNGQSVLFDIDLSVDSLERDLNRIKMVAEM